MKDYDAAGGAVLRDLFSENEATFLTDRPLATRLAAKRLQAVADAVRPEGWNWMEVCIEADSIHRVG